MRAEIARIAYYRAEQRGFTPGYELQDWLAAEDEVAACGQSAKAPQSRTQPNGGANMGTQDKDRQQNQGDEKRPGQQQGGNPQRTRQPGEDTAAQQSNRQQGGGSQSSPRQQEQQGDRQRGDVAKDDGISSGDIEAGNDAGTLSGGTARDRSDKPGKR
jgi:hypothetical protein